jgi:hypothetical protein
LSKKEKDDFLLAIELRQKGAITTPGQPFEASDKQEIDGLLANGVFDFELFNKQKHGN